jgi:hypothetical protein
MCYTGRGDALLLQHSLAARRYLQINHSDKHSTYEHGMPLRKRRPPK